MEMVKHYHQEGKPPCTVIWRKKPNHELMAKAYLQMYRDFLKENQTNTSESVVNN